MRCLRWSNEEEDEDDDDDIKGGRERRIRLEQRKGAYTVVVVSWNTLWLVQVRCRCFCNWQMDVKCAIRTTRAHALPVTCCIYLCGWYALECMFLETKQTLCTIPNVFNRIQILISPFLHHGFVIQAATVGTNSHVTAYMRDAALNSNLMKFEFLQMRSCWCIWACMLWTWPCTRAISFVMPFPRDIGTCHCHLIRCRV